MPPAPTWASFFLRASRGYVAAKIFPGAYGACITYLGSHKKIRASCCYMRNLNYIYRLKLLHRLRCAVQQLSVLREATQEI